MTWRFSLFFFFWFFVIARPFRKDSTIRYVPVISTNPGTFVGRSAIVRSSSGGKQSLLSHCGLTRRLLIDNCLQWLSFMFCKFLVENPIDADKHCLLLNDQFEIFVSTNASKFFSKEQFNSDVLKQQNVNHSFFTNYYYRSNFFRFSERLLQHFFAQSM